MARYYYSTQPFLAWILNHYFYGRVHFAWVGAPFYPYQLPNPRSSNPLRKYEDLYELWKDEDTFSAYLSGTRAGLRKGILANAGLLHPNEANRLHDVCDRIHPVFFYPLVYRVNIEKIHISRLELANSGLRGSQEYLIRNLREDPKEFEILFFDLKTGIFPQSFSSIKYGRLKKSSLWKIFGYWIII